MRLAVLLGSDCFAFPEPWSVSIKAHVGFIQHSAGHVKEKLGLVHGLLLTYFLGRSGCSKTKQGLDKEAVDLLFHIRFVGSCCPVSETGQ